MIKYTTRSVHHFSQIIYSDDFVSEFTDEMSIQGSCRPYMDKGKDGRITTCNGIQSVEIITQQK